MHSSNIRRAALTIERDTLNAILASPKARVSARPAPIAKLTPAEEQVRVLGLDEYKEAALTLAHAFKQDWVARYVLDVPDRESWTEEQKWELHLSIMEYLVYATILKGMATTVGPNYGAVALWMPPGCDMDDTLTTMRSGLWRLQYQLSREGKTRWFSEFMPLLHDTKHSVLGERDANSWYLVYLGTRPEQQGRGLAKRLIRNVTDQADAAGLPCYLESSNPRNPAIYRKYGFAIDRTIHLVRHEGRDIELDIMVREPVPVLPALAAAPAPAAPAQAAGMVKEAIVPVFAEVHWARRPSVFEMAAGMA